MCNVCIFTELLNVQDFRIDVSVPEATDDWTVGPNTCSNYYYVAFSIQDKPTDPQIGLLIQLHTILFSNAMIIMCVIDFVSTCKFKIYKFISFTSLVWI